MTQRPDDTNALDPFGMVKGIRDANMDAWSQIMQQFVNSEAYSQASGAMLDAYLTSSAPFRKLLEQTMTQVLTQLNMPTRSDITRLAERLTNIEMRLDDFDAQITAIGRPGPAQPAPAAPRRSGNSQTSDTAATPEAKAMDPVVDSISETGKATKATATSRSTSRSSKAKGGQ